MNNLTILVQPMYSKQELNADSNYVVYTMLVRAILEIRPDWYFVIIFPDAKSGYKYEDDGFFRHPNIIRVAQRISPRKFSNAVSYNGTWYDKLYRKYGFDIVWCNLVEIASRLCYAGEASFEKNGRPIVVAAHNYTIHESLPYPMTVMSASAIAQVSGAILSDCNVFNSDWCKQMLLEMASIWFNDDALRIVEDRSVRIDYGTLPQIEPIFNDNEVPIIAYNHRLQAYKQWKRTFAVLQELYDEGLRFVVNFYNNTREHLTYLQRFPFVKVILSSTHAEYLSKLGQCDLNVTNSLHETFCIAAIESMAYGQPLIAPNSVTFPQITGKANNGYPYLYDTVEQQKTYLRKLLTDKEERHKWGRILSDHVCSYYNSKLWAERYVELFERLTDFSLGVRQDAFDIARLLLEQAKLIGLSEYANLLMRTQVNGRHPFSNQSFPTHKIVRLVREFGGRVTIEKGKQMLYASGY